MTEIVLRIKHNDTCIDIEFPIEESPLYAKLAELHATDHEGDPFFVEKVLEPVELKDFFEGKSVDLDEINYLAKRIVLALASVAGIVVMCLPRKDRTFSE